MLTPAKSFTLRKTTLHGGKQEGGDLVSVDNGQLQINLGPTPGFVEQVYCLTPRADAHGRTKVSLHNAAATQAVELAYSVRNLPCLALWQNTAAVEEGHVTGIEPGTGFPNTRRV